MAKSALLNKAGILNIVVVLGVALMAMSFKKLDDWQLTSWANRSLKAWFDPDVNAKLKGWTLSVTPDYFLRFKRNYQGGKQEYYSFHLHRFKDMDYLGTTTNGLLRLITNGDDIIVQTYNDPKGDVDSMATSLDVPVRNIRPEQLDSLRSVLLQLKDRH